VPSPGAAEAREAERLGKAGDFLGAAAKFRDAYRIAANPKFLCNVGVAYYNAKDAPRAQLYLARCIEEGKNLDPKLVANLQAALTAVTEQLSSGDFTPLAITVDPAGAKVVVDAFGDADAFPAPRTVYVPPGTHAITAGAIGYVTAKTSVDARGHVAVPVHLAPNPVTSMTPDREQPGSHHQTPATVVAHSKVPAILTSAGAVALGAGSLVAFLHARTIVKGVETLDTKAAYDHEVSRGRTWQHVSWGLGAGAVAAAGVSAWLWIRATHSETTTLEVAPTSGGASATLGLRF
jgi:hypothetical protein